MQQPGDLCSVCWRWGHRANALLSFICDPVMNEETLPRLSFLPLDQVYSHFMHCFCHFLNKLSYFFYFTSLDRVFFHSDVTLCLFFIFSSRLYTVLTFLLYCSIVSYVFFCAFSIRTYSWWSYLIFLNYFRPNLVVFCFLWPGLFIAFWHNIYFQFYSFTFIFFYVTFSFIF